jgi:cutinase
MHSAVELIPEALFDKIKAIVLFGDPDIETAFPAGLEEKVLNNCASGDRVSSQSPSAYSVNV